jgi:hypothetical protein
MSPIVSRGKHVGVAVPCTNPIDPEHPNTVPEFALAINWIEANAVGMGVTPSRVGVWVQSPAGNVLYTLERGTRNLLSSTVIPFQTDVGPCVDGGLADVEKFFDLQLRGDQTAERPESDRRPGGGGRGFGNGDFGGREMGRRQANAVPVGDKTQRTSPNPMSARIGPRLLWPSAINLQHVMLI